MLSLCRWWAAGERMQFTAEQTTEVRRLISTMPESLSPLKAAFDKVLAGRGPTAAMDSVMNAYTVDGAVNARLRDTLASEYQAWVKQHIGECTKPEHAPFATVFMILMSASLSGDDMTADVRKKVSKRVRSRPAFCFLPSPGWTFKFFGRGSCAVVTLPKQAMASMQSLHAEEAFADEAEFAAAGMTAQITPVTLGDARGKRFLITQPMYVGMPRERTGIRFVWHLQVPDGRVQCLLEPATSRKSHELDLQLPSHVPAVEAMIGTIRLLARAKARNNRP